MISLSNIRVPTALLFLLFFLALSFSPVCPVQVDKTVDLTTCSPGNQCRTEVNFTQLDPPILVAASGSTWSMKVSGVDRIENYSFVANSVLVAIFFVLPFIIPLYWVMRADRKARYHYITFRRRHWRTFLWGLGFFLVVLSAFWSLNYLLFYGGVLTGLTPQAKALVDPLLTSLLSTFLLFGLGTMTMMLAVKSRALWPDVTKTD